jgi:hypothetical protein
MTTIRERAMIAQETLLEEKNKKTQEQVRILRIHLEQEADKGKFETEWRGELFRETIEHFSKAPECIVFTTKRTEHHGNLLYVISWK